jgi:DNA modification methylase
LADNRIAETSEWDPETLALEWRELRDLGAADDLSMIGFSEDEIADLVPGILTEVGAGLTDPDDVPEPPKVPVTQPGDVWLLGDHRIMCGDSTKAEAVSLLMDGKSAVLMQTDPPYGVAYANDERPNPGVAKPRVANDDLLEGEKLQSFLESAIRAALPHLHANTAFYLWHPMLTQGTFFAAAAAAAADILIHRQIIWAKPVLLLGRGDYHWKHELCFYGWVRGNRPPFYGPRNQTTIWEIASVSHSERKKMNHATPKPVAIWSSPIENHTKPGEIMYEPFSGSGSQIVAAEMTGRRCFAMELSPAYVDVAVKRWQDYTGKKAVHAVTGVAFDEAAAERSEAA